jgi:hypothetical protein
MGRERELLFFAFAPTAISLERNSPLSLPNNLSAYEDCLKYYDDASAAPKGIRIPVDSDGEAHHLRLRLNHTRVLLRDETKRVFERADPRWGKSEFDRFRVTMRPPASGPNEPGYWVYIEPWVVTAAEPEEL